MKNNLWLKLCCVTILLLAVSLMVACNTQDTPNDTTADTTASNIVTTPETELETQAPVPVMPDFYETPDIVYDCQDDSTLRTYQSKTLQDFTALYDYYQALGYSVYSQSQKNGNSFATLTSDSHMAHMYFYAHNGELNLVTSETAAATLPAKVAITGDKPITFTQMKDSSHVNGMGYVIQLSDGSFIIYDGSYQTQARILLQTLQDMAGDGDILVRAWVLTHSHDDHYPTFSLFAKKHSQKVKVEHVILAPINETTAVEIGGDNYMNTKFKEDMKSWPNAKVVYAHSGMEFTFGDLHMEVLLAADDIFKNDNHNNYFNNSSLVTRLYTSDYSVLFTGDIGKEGCQLMMDAYGDYLQSNVCQISHHGVEDAPLAFYEVVKASILLYPCNKSLYDLVGRYDDVRLALEQLPSTKEILIAGLGQFSHEWGATFDADAPLSMPNYQRPTI